MDLSIINKHSSRSLAFSVVFWSCLGGLWLGMGIDELIDARLQYHWIWSLMFGAAVLAMGIFYAVMLLRRTTPSSSPTPVTRS